MVKKNATTEVVLCANQCGNPVEPGYSYCAPCHLKWRQRRVAEEDRNTRPLRADTEERLKRVEENFARYYRSADRSRWPLEVREALEAALSAFGEGDRRAREAANPDNPNPGLFQVARAHYYQARNHLSVARFHSARISIEGINQGLPRYVQKQVEIAMGNAVIAFAVAEKLEGTERTRQLAEATRLMGDALAKAREERSRLRETKAEEFYSGKPIGDCLPEEQLAALVENPDKPRRGRGGKGKGRSKPTPGDGPSRKRSPHNRAVERRQTEEEIRRALNPEASS